MGGGACRWMVGMVADHPPPQWSQSSPGRVGPTVEPVPRTCAFARRDFDVSRASPRIASAVFLVAGLSASASAH